MPTEPANNPASRDIPGILMAVAFIVIASVSIWDTTHMVDADSYVFPRAIAAAMIVFSMALIIWNLVRPAATNGEAVPGASTPRRVGLIAAMLVSTALMPYLGFLVSGIGAFAAIMMLAMYDPWTPKRKLLYPLVCVGLVLGFYTVFAKVLLVPLPTGLLFD